MCNRSICNLQTTSVQLSKIFKQTIQMTHTHTHKHMSSVSACHSVTLFDVLFYFVLQGIFAFQCVQFERITYNDTYLYPWWADLVGWFMTLASLMFIPGIALYKLCTVPGNLTLKEVCSQIHSCVFLRFSFCLITFGDYLANLPTE